MMQRTIPGAVLFVIGLAGVALVGVSRGGADQPGSAAGKRDDLPGKYKGLNMCAGCHTEPSVGFKDVWPLFTFTEVPTFEKCDRHGLAYAALIGERGRQMGRLLGYKVHTSDQCLGCHAVPTQAPQLTRFQKEDGVSCEVCHGPAERWFNKHVEKGFDKRPPAEKKELGMRPVAELDERAHLCASCHVGSTEQHKVVTHEMYAAGHPPLPSIETVVFLHDMPPHWIVRRKKDARIQEMLASSVITFEDTMHLLATQAAEADKPNAGASLDFAQFDCYACHHDLKLPGWRQQRGYQQRLLDGSRLDVKPGRPQPPAWSLVLVKLALRSAEPDESHRPLTSAFDAQLRALYTAYSSRPFGDTARIAQAAENLATWAQKLQAELANRKHFDRRLLVQLCQLAELEYPDYESARQMAWALDVLGKNLELPSAEQKQVLAVVQKLQAHLVLDVNTATVDRAKRIGEELKKHSDWPFHQIIQQPVVAADLQALNARATAKVQASIANYDPADVRASLQQLHTWLTAQKTTSRR